MKPLVHSYSSLNDYEICPRRYYHKWIARDLPPEEKSAAQLEGTRVHDAFKKRLRLGDMLPEDLQHHEPLAAGLIGMKMPLHVELKLGMKEDGTACGFFDDGVWLRGTADTILLSVADHWAWLGDWKNGKVREDPMELLIQALLLQSKWPDIQTIDGSYIWLTMGKAGQSHDLSDTLATFKWVRERASKIKQRLGTQDWPPDEGPLCGWCPVTKEMCEHKR